MYLLCVLALATSAIASISALSAIALVARQQRSNVPMAKIVPLHHPAVRGGA